MLLRRAAGAADHLNAKSAGNFGGAFDPRLIDLRDDLAHHPEPGFGKGDENDAALHHAERPDLSGGRAS